MANQFCFDTKYDFLVVGAGLFGATFANLAHAAGRRVLVIEKNAHIGGNCADREINGIPVCDHGGHIFHTNDEWIWKYVGKFASFTTYEHRVKARSGGQFWSFPINLGTFYEYFGVGTPALARKYPLDELTQLFYPGYSEKMWGVRYNTIPAEITQRIPVRYTWDDLYFDDMYQGMPIAGYTPMILWMLDGVNVCVNTDYNTARRELSALAEKVIYTGSIDDLFDRDLGTLPYRTIRRERSQGSEELGTATINYCDLNVPFTRRVSYSVFYRRTENIIDTEYPEAWNGTDGGRDYPLWDRTLYQQYADRLPANVHVGGRLGSYRYLNMDQTIAAAMKLWRELS